MRTFRRLAGLLRSSWRLVILAVALGWATTISWFALISASAYLISYAALQPSIAELQVAIVGVRFFGISRAVFRYLERLVSHTVTFELLTRLRTWLFSRIEPLAPAGLETETSGDLLSKLVSDIDTLQDFYVRTIAPPLVALLSSAGILWFVGQWNRWFAVILLIFHLFTGVLVPLAVIRFGKRTSGHLVRMRAKMSHLVVDAIQGTAEVQVFDQKTNFLKRLRNISQQEEAVEIRYNRILGGHGALVSFLVNLAVMALLLAAIPLVEEGHLDGRLLAVVILGAIASFEAILPLPQAFQNLEENLTAGRRIFKLADKQPLFPEGEDALADPARIDIEFKQLEFAYSPEDMLVLSGLDLVIPFGKKIAILGPSGEGKSTIASLLLKFWLPSGGKILVNGAEITSVSSPELRRRISYLPQNPFLFNTSIEENIRIGEPDALIERVRRVVDIAGLGEFIQSLPDGYQTSVGEFGTKLSGGQRQRLALARTLVRDVPIYIFDEPTVNLDTVTEKTVIDNVLKALAGRTIIWITHRLDGLDQMDEIVLLSDGQVIERGTHRQLLARGGRYARMVQIGEDNLG